MGLVEIFGVFAMRDLLNKPRKTRNTRKEEMR